MEEQEAMVTIMALICYAIIAACGKILSTHGDINVSKTLVDRMGHTYVCVILKNYLSLFFDILYNKNGCLKRKII